MASIDIFVKFKANFLSLLSKLDNPYYHTEDTNTANNIEQEEEEEDTVIDLSSSGSCSWCHKHGPCALEDSGGTSVSSCSVGLNGITG